MKKLCCIPCTETPNVHVSLDCLSACCSKNTKRTSIRKEKPPSKPQDTQSINAMPANGENNHVTQS